MIKIIIVPGPPALGKTTFINQKIKESIDLNSNHQVYCISPDNFVYNESGIYEWTPERADAAWKNSYAAFEKIRDQIDFVKNIDLPEPNITIYFDATLTSKKTRQTFKNKIDSIFKGYLYQLMAYNIESVGLDLMIERNNQRSPDRKVPMETFKRMFENWKPVENDEGFIVL